MKRLILAFLLTSISTPAFACSCMPWQGGLVSEFVSDYTSFWGVPVQAAVTPEYAGRLDMVVIYQIEVLNSYSRLSTNGTEVISSIADGGSCGIQLTIGVPQFLVARDLGENQFHTSTCTPHIPYKAIKNYLENGVDANVPADYECLNEKNEISLENPDCVVWEGAVNSRGRQGQEDWSDYWVAWRDNKRKFYTPR